jgi:hypothetical protein
MLDFSLIPLNATNPGLHLAYIHRIQGARFTTNPFGFATFTGFIPLPLDDSFLMYDRPDLPHFHVSWNGLTVWEGRVEDVSIINGGVRLGAFGYQRALGDAPYTALWSTTSVADWRIVDNRIGVAGYPDRYEFDNNNRLYISPRKNSVLGNTTNNKAGRWGYVIPHQSARNLITVSFDYAFRAPTNWRTLLFSWATVAYPIGSGAWSSPTIEWTLNGNGSEQTGSQSLTITSAQGLQFSMDYNAADATYASETGTDYLKITNLRIKSTTTASVYASEIASALVAYVNGVNSSQLQNVTALIESPALDLREEIYEDELPSDILTKLVRLGDNQTPPRQWEWGVWENRMLHFRPRGSQGRAWYVDVSELELERTIDMLSNAAYALYQDESNRPLRTAVATDADSIARYGLTRRAKVDASTTSATQAGVHRDAFLDDRADPIPRIGIRFARLFDASGALWPNWMARSGDTVTIRNLPPTLSTAIDRIRTFRVSETRYAVDTNVIELVPESPLPSLETLMVRREEGIVRSRVVK